MEIFLDPAIWAGLLTLIVLEIVLGIDNLIFIAILADKLPPEQRQKARVVGLSLALVMRLVLLASISWLTSLTATLFTIFTYDISWRDLILFIGGIFLIFKATMELHEKLEGAQSKKTGPIHYSSFWSVIIQIIVLDAVFSLDSVITAIGMTPHIEVMMLAVIIAMMVMIYASSFLMDFVSQHPTVVILCLGFLLMIGFSLIVEGLDYHIPKGYLYAAIGFSVLIEGFNQFAQRNRRKTYEKIDARTRLSEAVIGLLGSKTVNPNIQSELATLKPRQEEANVFKPEERLMINRVLQLSEQPVRAIMTPRSDLYWIDLNDKKETIEREILECSYSCIVVTRDGDMNVPLGVLIKKDIANMFLEKKTLGELEKIVRQPLIVPDSMTVLQTMDSFRKSKIHIAFVIDEYGTLEGLVTLTDVMEAIAGDMPEDHATEDDFTYEILENGSFIINGNLTMQELTEILNITEFPEGDYSTAAGIALNVLQKVPVEGDSFMVGDFMFTIKAMDGRRVGRIFIKREIPGYFS
jgi:CBS domain containing-hemolysin-like protein